MRWIGLVAGVLVAAFACASTPPPIVWQRVDGVPVAPNTLIRDEAICEGRVASLPACRLLACVAHRKTLQRRDYQTRAGCMAEHGWIPAPAEPE
jgi:hypothetical protein